LVTNQGTLRGTGASGTGAGYSGTPLTRKLGVTDAHVVLLDRLPDGLEQLLVAALSQCHMLWYLVLCAKEGIVVTEYADRASGTLVDSAGGSGHFEEATLRPLSFM